MNEPKRILDSEESLSRTLLASAEDDRAPAASRAKAMAVLGIGAATAATVTTTAGAATGAKVLGFKWLAIALLPVAAGTAYVATRRHTEAPAPAVSIAPSVSMVPPAVSPPSPSIPPVVEPIVSAPPP